jgi:hypothetical protein
MGNEPLESPAHRASHCHFCAGQQGTEMKRIIRRLSLFTAALALVACQGSGRVHEAPPAGYPLRNAPPAPAPEPPLQKGTKDDFARAPQAADAREEQRARPAPSSPAAPRAEYESGAGSAADAWRSAPPAEARPGLATHWGEQRYSPTREVDFERMNAARPDALTQLFYNDRSGALGLAGYSSWGQGEVAFFGGQVTARVVDGYGGVLPALHAPERVTVMGDAGERYAIELYNRSSMRFEVVVSVDGLDVLDGEDGDLDKRGYLLGAYQSLSIDGFRDSQNSVAAFRFGDVGRSYAASKGKARNVGVIGIALFRERGQRNDYSAWPYYYDENALRRSADPFPGRYSAPPRRYR